MKQSSLTGITSKSLTRRSLFRAAAISGASVLASSAFINSAYADPDNAETPKAPAPAQLAEPDVYSFLLKDLQAYVILDRTLAFPGIQPAFAPQAKAKELAKVLQNNFLPADHIALSVNILVLKRSNGVTLIDAGVGDAFGEPKGALMAGLKRINIAAADVKEIFITHAHPDHLGGLLDAAGQPVFQNARIYIAKTELDFWTSANPDVSGMGTDAETKANVVAGAKKFLTILQGSLQGVSAGKISEGIELVSTPGHTPGHAAYLISQGDQKILHLGDLVHSYALQFAHPEWTMIFDVNSPLAVKTRKEIFAKAAADRLALFGYHLPYPGIGYARKEGAGYSWVPRPWAV